MTTEAGHFFFDALACVQSDSIKQWAIDQSNIWLEVIQKHLDTETKWVQTPEVFAGYIVTNALG